MKNASRLLVFTLTLALAASSAIAQSRRSHPARSDNPFKKVLRCLSIVDLNEDQKTQIRDIFETARPVLQELGQELRADRETLRALLEADLPEECAIGSALLEVKEDGKAIREVLENTMASVKSVLSPEQAAKLEGCLQAPRDFAPDGDD